MRLLIKLFAVVTLMTLSFNAVSAPVVVGIAAGIAALGVGAATMTALAVGMAAASAYMAFTMKVPTTKQTQQELKQTVRMPRTPRNVAYGKVYTSGAMLFAEEQVGDTANSDGTYNEWLYLAIGLFNHPINSVSKVILNETDISEFGAKAVHTLHNDDSDTDASLLANAPSWKADMTGDGVTWSALSLQFDRELFANGIPTLRLETEGKNDLWDPRDDTYGYSNNAAIVILDFLMTYLGIDKSRIITEGFGSFIDAVNLCDEGVINPDDSTGTRYTINGVFNLNEKPLDVLTDMLAACGGNLVRMGGQYGLLPAAYNGPATFTLTESDIIGDIDIQVEPSTQDAINTVKGSFVDPEQNYVDTDYPPVVDENAYVNDGGELSLDLSFRFVSDAYQAQRLASIVLKKSLAGGQISIKTNYKGAYARLGRVISLDIPTLSIIGEYRVVEYSGNLSDGFDLVLAREDLSIYDDAVGTPFVAPPLTNLPVGQVAPPTGLQFITESIGEVVQGVVQWRINAPQSVSTDIRFKDFISGDVIQVGNSIGSTFNVNGLKAGNYTVEVRTVTASGATSSWVATTLIVDVPPVPDSVTVNASNWNVELIPVVTAGIPTGTLFEFKYLADNASYLTGNPTYGEGNINLAKTVATSSSLNHGGLTPDRYQHYWVRGVNAYGESDWIYVRTGTTKEQDLVTTVVERLEAIEIVSSNYVEGESGYKLFAPDPNAPENDGRAEFNDIYARGDIVAETLTLTGSIPSSIDNSKVTTDSIGAETPTGAQNKADAAQSNAEEYTEGRIYPDQNSLQIKSANYLSGSRGWAISKAGNAEFNNVTVRGVGYFTDGEFEGTIYTKNLVGGVTSVIVKSIPSNTYTGELAKNSWFDILSFKVVNAYDFGRALIVSPVELNSFNLFLNSPSSNFTCNYVWRLYSPSLDKTYYSSSGSVTVPPEGVVISQNSFVGEIPENELPSDIKLQWRYTAVSFITTLTSNSSGSYNFKVMVLKDDYEIE